MATFFAIAASYGVNMLSIATIGLPFPVFLAMFIGVS
jgi:hypothetical protein